APRSLDRSRRPVRVPFLATGPVAEVAADLRADHVGASARCYRQGARPRTAAGEVPERARRRVLARAWGERFQVLHAARRETVARGVRGGRPRAPAGPMTLDV